jgi:hypothetical protein
MKSNKVQLSASLYNSRKEMLKSQEQPMSMFEKYTGDLRTESPGQNAKRVGNVSFVPV